MKKSTFFEGSIRSRSKEEFIAYFAKWLKAIEERGYMVQKEEVLKIPIPKKRFSRRREIQTTTNQRSRTQNTRNIENLPLPSKKTDKRYEKQYCVASEGGSY